MEILCYSSLKRQNVLVFRAHAPSGLHLGSRPLATPNSEHAQSTRSECFLSVHTQLKVSSDNLVGSPTTSRNELLHWFRTQ